MGFGLYKVENPANKASDMMNSARSSYAAMGQNRTSKTENPGPTAGGAIGAGFGGAVAGSELAKTAAGWTTKGASAGAGATTGGGVVAGIEAAGSVTTGIETASAVTAGTAAVEGASVAGATSAVSATTGAAEAAAAGSGFGPWGAAIGAAIGIGAYLFS